MTYSMNISGFFDYYALLNVYKTVITLSIFTGDIQPSVYHFYFIVKKKRMIMLTIMKYGSVSFNEGQYGDYRSRTENCNN